MFWELRCFGRPLEEPPEQTHACVCNMRHQDPVGFTSIADKSSFTRTKSPVFARAVGVPILVVLREPRTAHSLPQTLVP